MWLLHVISYEADLKQICRDVGNSFPNAYKKEKVCIHVVGVDFVEYEG